MGLLAAGQHSVSRLCWGSITSPAPCLAIHNQLLLLVLSKQSIGTVHRRGQACLEDCSGAAGREEGSGVRAELLEGSTQTPNHTC